MIDLPPAFVCEVVKVHDGDGPLWCRNGVKVRVAGIQAPDYESAQPCRIGRANYVCDNRRAAASQRVTQRLTLNKRLINVPGLRQLRLLLIIAASSRPW